MVLPFAPALAPSRFLLQGLERIEIAPALAGLLRGFFILGTGMVLQALIFGGIQTPFNVYIELHLKFQLQNFGERELHLKLKMQLNLYIVWGLNFQFETPKELQKVADLD